MDLRIAFTLIHMMYKDLSNPSPRFFHIFSLSSKRLGMIYLHDAGNRLHSLVVLKELLDALSAQCFGAIDKQN